MMSIGGHMILKDDTHFMLLIALTLAKKSNGDSSFVPSSELSLDGMIEQRKIKTILRPLVKAGILEGRCGRRGGYRFLRAPESVTISELFRAAYMYAPASKSSVKLHLIFDDIEKSLLEFFVDVPLLKAAGLC